MIGDLIVYVVAVLLPVLAGGALLVLARRRRSAQAPAGWRAVLAGNALLFLLLASTAFLLLESYYRFWYDTTDSFAQTRVTQQWFQRHFERNNAGFRDNVPYFFPRAPGKPRLSFLGDSFTAGHGVPNVEDRFANRVRAHKKGRWDVHVLAEVGRDTGAELKVLRELVRDGYQLDSVVLVYCLNDINDLASASEQTGSVTAAELQRRPGYLVEHSYFINLYYFRMKGRLDPRVADYYGEVRAAYDGPLWDEQQRRLVELREVCQAAGGQLYVVTFPFLHALGPQYPYVAVHEKLDEFWRGLGVPHLDLLPVLERRRGESLTVNAYDAHPNERAHQLAADAIIAFLDPLIAAHATSLGSRPRHAADEFGQEPVRFALQGHAFLDELGGLPLKCQSFRRWH